MLKLWNTAKAVFVKPEPGESVPIDDIEVKLDPGAATAATSQRLDDDLDNDVARGGKGTRTMPTTADVAKVNTRVLMLIRHLVEPIKQQTWLRAAALVQLWLVKQGPCRCLCSPCPQAHHQS